MSFFSGKFRKKPGFGGEIKQKPPDLSANVERVENTPHGTISRDASYTVYFASVKKLFSASTSAIKLQSNKTNRVSKRTPG